MKLIGGVNDLEDLTGFLQNRRSRQSRRSHKKYNKSKSKITSSRRNGDNRKQLQLREKRERKRRQSEKNERIYKQFKEVSMNRKSARDIRSRNKKFTNKTRRIKEENKKKFKPKQLENNKRPQFFLKNLINRITQKPVETNLYNKEVPPKEELV
tara:strand:- start:40 stop:501 length:462 start_codon:yes stop_codon:yes gene_type:complete